MQRYFATGEQDRQWILEDSDYHHIKNVMRMQDGAEVEIVYQNNLYLGKIMVNGNNFVVNKYSSLETTTDKMPKVVLYIPLLKEQKMDFILQKATELGVDEIIPLILERSLIKLDENKFLKKQERWQKICKEASEQSKRTSIPKIGTLHKIDDLADVKSVKLVCSTQEKVKNLKNIVKSFKDCDKISVVIGPEGGLSANEELRLEQLGFIPVSLGTRIMRVETVPLFLMSVLNYEYME